MSAAPPGRRAGQPTAARGLTADPARVLVAAAADLAAAVTAGEVAGAADAIARTHLGASRAVLWVHEEDVRLLRCVAPDGGPAPVAPRPDVVRTDDGSPPAAALTDGVTKTWLGTPPRGRVAAGGSGMEPVNVAVPLSSRGRRLGVLEVGFPSPPPPDAEIEIDVLGAVADLCATALDRSYLLEAEQEARRTLQFLATATNLLVEALDPSEVVNRLVHLAVPALADWCTVYLADGPWLRRVAMAIDGHPDLARRLTRIPLAVDDDAAPCVAYRTGEAQPISSALGHLVDRLYPAADVARLAPEVDAGSGLCLPIVARGERVGAIGLAFLSSRRRPSARLVDALAGLAGRAGIALDVARRYSQRQEVVRTLVDALLPPGFPAVAGLELAARYIPAGAEVAGDWYEADPMPDGSLLLGVGDAAGHGLAAASLMAELRHGARALASVQRSPAMLLADLTQRLRGAERADTLATAAYLRLDAGTGEGVWASAGHVPPILVRAGGRAEVLDGGGPPLGAPAGTGGPPTDRPIHLGPGDTLVLYTDGTVERRGESLEVGIARLAATTAGAAGRTLEGVADLVVDVHCRTPEDDCCLLLARRVDQPG